LQIAVRKIGRCLVWFRERFIGDLGAPQAVRDVEFSIDSEVRVVSSQLLIFLSEPAQPFRPFIRDAIAVCISQKPEATTGGYEQTIAMEL
jgi:hypothetical protein